MMRRKWIGVVAMCLLVCGAVMAEEAQMKTFSGTVTGPDGSPVAEAVVDLYFLTVDEASMSYQVRSLGQTTSDAEGKFAFAVDTPSTGSYEVFSCLAQKKGLSSGWETITDANKTQFNIQMTEPQKMIGFVQNPDGTPVPEAQVRLAFVAVPGGEEKVMFGIDPVDVFATKTCSDGRFEFDNLPEQATAEFLVKKAGKGTLLTMDASMNPENGLTYKAGQTEIMLTLQNGFKLTGKLVAQSDQKPIPGIRVMVVDTKLPINLSQLPLESAEDGSFEFTDLAPGDYTVSILDNDWIAEPKTISVSGDVEGTTLELTKGGAVEITVIDSATEKPVSGAQVNLRCEENDQRQQAKTDESGIAKKQLLPGTYRVSAYGQGYRYMNDVGTVVVENNKTAALTVQLGGQSKVAGVVLDPDDKPFSGAEIRMVPNSGQQQGITSDEKGQFKMAWDPEQLSWAQGEFYLIAASPDQNLAGVTLIAEDTKEATIKLQKGVEIKGKVLNAEGQPIPAARVNLYFRGSRFGSSFGKDGQTNDQGEYTFTAIAPEQKYSVNINNAKGYGTDSVDVQPGLGQSSLAVEDIVLRVADQKLSGQVVDVDGKGLPNVRLYCYGQGQPNLNSKTGEDGKFAFDNVCSGEISISANYNQGSDYMYGNVRTEGGAEDVTIVLTPQGGNQRYVPKTPPSLVGKPLPDLSACGVAIPADANAVLVYAWDMNQRPSRHFLKQLAAKAALLKDKGVTVILLNTTPVDKPKLDGFLSDSQITWPCGVMTDNAEDMLFKLGIQSLPWLILTDPEHNVIAEGLSVDELENKIDMP